MDPLKKTRYTRICIYARSLYLHIDVFHLCVERATYPLSYYITYTKKYLYYDPGNTLRKFGPIGSRQSYFSAHKETMKPLQLLEILSLLKARK